MNSHRERTGPYPERRGGRMATAPVRPARPAPPRATAMDHRVGQRWRADLPIEVGLGHEGVTQSSRLLEISRNGARVRLYGQQPLAGEAVRVRFTGMAVTVYALIIHVRGGEAGLLWIERPAWLERLVQAVRRHPPAVISQ